jgi:hypothetical protein
VASSAFANSSIFSFLRAVKMTSQPPAANFVAIAFPNPELAPVIKMIFDIVL